MSAKVPVSVVFILLVELCERFTFYTLTGSQKFYLGQKLGYGNAQATSITTVFNGACYLACLPGGVLGDRFLGRYRTIFMFSALYVAGAMLTAFAAMPHVNSKLLFFVGAFGGVAVGTGGIKPNVCNFGADQIQGRDTEAARSKFFSYFYWMINIGAVVALGLMTTVASSPETFGIDHGDGYFVAYGSAAGAMAVCLALFLIGTPSYVKRSVVSTVRTMRPIGHLLVRSARRSRRGKVALFGWLLFVPFFVLAFAQAFAPGGSTEAVVEAWLAFGICSVMLTCLTWAHCDNSFLDHEGDGGEELLADSINVTDARRTFQTIPMLAIANTVFNVCYTMMLGPFLSQSCQMDLRLPGSTSQVSGAIFNVADSLVIVLFIPVFESVVFPMIARWRGTEVTRHQKLVAGFFFAALAMASAAGVEFWRRSSPVIAPEGWIPGGSPQNFPDMPFGPNNPYSKYSSLMGQCTIDGVQYCSNCAPKVSYPYADPDAGQNLPEKYEGGIYMSELSGFWMFIPFGLVGLGEILVNPTLYYYAYAMTPAKTRSVVQAINLLFQGALPPALVAVFSTVLASYQPDDLNRGHIEVFYYACLILVVVGTPVFFVVVNSCHLETPEPNDESHISTRTERDARPSSFVESYIESGRAAGHVTTD